MPQPSPLQPCPHVPVFVHYLFIFLVTYWTVRVSSEYKKEGRTAALAGALSLDCSDDEGGSPGGGSGGGGQMPVVYSWMKKGFHQPLQGQKSPKSKASLAKLCQIGLNQNPCLNSAKLVCFSTIFGIFLGFTYVHPMPEPFRTVLW